MTTPDEVAAQQISQVGADLGAGPAAPDPASLGITAAAAGAQPAEVDAGALLSSIQALQARLDQLEAEKRADEAPAVVNYAQALADHVRAKVDAHPYLVTAPDNPLSAGGDLAGKVLAAARTEADNPGSLAGPIADLETWVRAHARQFPHVDWNYVLELAGETAAAAARLAA